MKAQARILLAILTLTICLPAAAQEREAAEPAAQEPAAKEPWLFVGPRAGVTWAASASHFDQELQRYGTGPTSPCTASWASACPSTSVCARADIG
jgi:hypothetical protein